jgi:DNA mismatch repair protein MutS2
VLLDEVGSGIDPLEGAPLAEAVLDVLYERGTLTLVTTHLGRLKEYAYRRRKCENASMEFDPEKLAPTFRIVVGLPGRSNALVIAERIGMPSEVVESARRASRDQDAVDHEVVDAMQRAQKDLERRSREAEGHRKRALHHSQEIARQGQEAEKARSALEYELERVEELKISTAVAHIRHALDQLGELPGAKGDALSDAHVALAQALESTDLAVRRLDTARSLGKGDAVFIPRFQKVCEVRKINKEKQRLVVLINGVATDISFAEISWVLPPPGFEIWWKCDEGSVDPGEMGR